MNSEEIWKDLVNTDSIYYKLLLQVYEENKDQPLEKHIGREIHHKVPKFYFKMNNLTVDNSEENLVSLSKKDHFLAHYYLWKCANEKYAGKAAGPINFMLKFVTRGLSTLNITDEDVLYIEALMKNGSGNLSVKGTHWYNNGEAQVMAKECPEGFVPGRICFKTFAELKLKKAEERKKLHSQRLSTQGKQVQLRKAKEYIESEIGNYPQGFKDLILQHWQKGPDSLTVQKEVRGIKLLVEEYLKDPSIWDVIKYYVVLHPEEWPNVHKKYIDTKRREAYVKAGKERHAKTIEKFKEEFEEFLRKNPNHSKYWYWYSFTNGACYIKDFSIKVTEKESKQLMGLAYREVNEENLGWTDFRRFFQLHKLELIERLERKELLEPALNNSNLEEKK